MDLPHQRPTVVRPSGYLDVDAEPSFRTDVLDAVDGAPGAPDVVVDLSDVAFMDSTGMAVLATGHVRAQARGGRLVVVHPPRIVERAMRLMGLEALLEAAASS